MTSTISSAPQHDRPRLRAAVHPCAPGWVALDELLEADTDLRLLDVRTPAEFGTAHIPGAYNVPLDTLAEHSHELQRHLEMPVVVICRTGNRARQAEQRLAPAGMANVHVLQGGMEAWDDGRREVRRGSEKWALERQVRLVAGSIVLGGILVSLKWPKARFVSGAVGTGLTFAALTDTCAMGMALPSCPTTAMTPATSNGSCRADRPRARPGPHRNRELTCGPCSPARWGSWSV